MKQNYKQYLYMSSITKSSSLIYKKFLEIEKKMAKRFISGLFIEKNTNILYTYEKRLNFTQNKNGKDS